MSCSKHLWTSPDNCPACRNSKWMQQSQRHHEERMSQFKPAPATSPRTTGYGLVKFGAIVLLAVLAVPVFLLFVLVSLLGSIVTGAAALAGLLVKGAFIGLLVGGVSSAVIYVVQRRQARDEAPTFAFSQPDSSLPVKERALTAYRSLDPVTSTAVKFGALAGAVAFCWVVLL